ncbi:MAG: leucyl aminopeptidase family protein [Myxococcota bacterium]
MEASLFFAPRATKTTVDIHLLSPKAARIHVKNKASSLQRGFIKARGFETKAGHSIALPGRDGSVAAVLCVAGDRVTPWSFASLARTLPRGRYRLLCEDRDAAEAFSLGWALGQYAFDKYKAPRKKPRQLVMAEGARAERVLRLAEATFLVRDLVTTPANDLVPADLANAAKAVGDRYGAKTTIIKGKALERDYPMVHAVGRASVHAPCYVDLRWGDADAPKVTLVGKGVIFDSGGLDLKPASAMLTMKKDMGGAAHAIALAGAIMDAKLPVRLRLLVPCVENAIGGNAFRPLDVLPTRKGLTVEIGNTDAEGRLILCDALADAADEAPDFIFDFATLTGAARVALGTELPALFCNDELLATEILAGGQNEYDALWRMPLHADYNRHLSSQVADVSNTSSTRFGGAITAALFLQRFVGPDQPWAHVDVMAYNSGSRAGRPKGGEAMGVRAAYAAIEARYGATAED